MKQLRKYETAQMLGGTRKKSQKSHPKYPLVIKEHVNEILTVAFERLGWSWKEKAHKFDGDTWSQNHVITPLQIQNSDFWGVLIFLFFCFLTNF